MSVRQLSEREPLLAREDVPAQPTAYEPLGRRAVAAEDAARVFDNGIAHGKRQLGVRSTTFLIFNRLIGTGIFATPSIILRASGSVGFSLVMWTLGAAFAAAGTAVYIELGTALPRSGGEKVYLEYFFGRPKFFMTCIVCAYFVINGGSAANSVVFGEYALHALALPASETAIRLVAFATLTLGFLLHSTRLRWGVRVMDALGTFKLAVLAFMALAGLLHVIGAPGFALQDGVDVPHNFEKGHFWEGTRGGVNAFVTGIYTVTWSYHGYQTANYALSEVRDPVRTMRIAGPLAVGLVTVLFLFVNLAYFAVVSKADILLSGHMAGALFFRNLFGPSTGRFFSFIIACSTLGNVLCTLFSYGRVVQELGREGVLPFASFFSSNAPFNAPMAGMGAQWATSSAIMLAAPPGDAYIFLLNLSLYPFSVYNTLIAGGLLAARLSPLRFGVSWAPPFRAFIAAIAFYFACNVFLLVAPLLPPERGFQPYQSLPYWAHPVTGLSISLVGATYWYVSFVWAPRRGGYVLERQLVVKEDGIPRKVFVKVAVNDS